MTDNELDFTPETKTANLDDILIEKLERALDKPTQSVVAHDVAKIASEHSAVDLAVTASRLPPHARALLFQNFTSVEEQIKFMINTDSTTRIAVFREITDQEVISLIKNMRADMAVEVLEDLTERRYRKVLEGLEPAKAQQIKEIEKNARNTAGRLMTNEFFSFSMDVTIGEVASTIRNHPGIDLTRRIFVLGPDGELQGYVPGRTLIVNPPETPLKRVMRPVLQKVGAEATREEVVEIVERYKISALPVVDEQDKLIGVVTYEDVIDALEDILDATIGSVAGTTEKVFENETIFKRFLSRAPWLIVTLCAGFVNVWVISTFESFEKGMLTFILFFIPLITGMSGNIGIQCSTVLVRSMAMGLLTPGYRREAIYRELKMGLIAACVFGVLSGALIFLMDFVGLPTLSASPLAIGLIVSMGLFGSSLAGTLLGVFSPFFFSRLGVDPAVASGPMVTALNDFFSMTIYFLIATGISALIL